MLRRRVQAVSRQLIYSHYIYSSMRLRIIFLLARDFLSYIRLRILKNFRWRRQNLKLYLQFPFFSTDTMTSYRSTSDFVKLEKYRYFSMFKYYCVTCANESWPSKLTNLVSPDWVDPFHPFDM